MKIKNHLPPIINLFLSLSMFSSQTFSQNNLTLTSNLTIDGTATYDNVMIKSGGILTLNGTLIVNNVMTIEAGGVVNHAARYLAGLKLIVNDSLRILGGGSINVSNRGLLGGNGGSIFGNDAEVFNSNGNIVRGTLGAAGSYGGIGQIYLTTPTNAAYGTQENPIFLGSGGGSDGASRGGNGGGRITIECPIIVHNGGMSANGETGLTGGTGVQFGSAGGSGGSILIRCIEIIGSGTINAAGGDGAAPTGSTKRMPGGGGGRIAIFYENFAIPLNIPSARGGRLRNDTGFSYPSLIGSPGTIYLENTTTHENTLIIRNLNYPTTLITSSLSSLTSLHKLIANERSRFRIAHDLHVNTLEINTFADLFLTSQATVQLPSFNQPGMINGDFIIQSGATLILSDNILEVPNGIILVKDGKIGEHDRLKNIYVRSGGMITHQTRSINGLTLQAEETIQVDDGGLINCNNKGLLGGLVNGVDIRGEHYLSNGTIGTGSTSNTYDGCGASHGGLGAVSFSGGSVRTVYGHAQNPMLLGSGGAGIQSPSTPGANGGGLIKLNANKIKVNGIISVYGGNATRAAGGGSGGSILIHCDTIEGSGSIIANGGNSSTNGSFIGGAGGGGRIAIYTFNPLLPPVNVRSNGGLVPGHPSFNGHPGTVVYLNCSFSITCPAFEVFADTLFLDLNNEAIVPDYTENVLLNDPCSINPIIRQIPPPGSVINDMGGHSIVIVAEDQEEHLVTCLIPILIIGDLDGDGFSGVTDCNDLDPTMYPGAPELCDGLDNNCDGLIPENELDLDRDGFNTCEGDCDDQNPTVYPGAPEICDRLDNNCDGIIPENELDLDGDGFNTCEGDCDDQNHAIYPGASEMCDGLDNNCDGVIPDNEMDFDGDGLLNCQDNCPSNANHDQTDSDCDGVGDICDQCEGGDDKIDTNHDGLPDCAIPPVFAKIIDAWKCEDHKVLICHNYDNRPTTICVDTSSLQTHLDHGDYLGPCNTSFCGSNAKALTGSSLSASDLEIYPNPFEGSLQIQFNADHSGDLNIHFYNLNGQMIMKPYRVGVVKGKNILEVKTMDIPSGMYFFQIVKPDGQTELRKVIKGGS